MRNCTFVVIVGLVFVFGSSTLIKPLSAGDRKSKGPAKRRSLPMTAAPTPPDLGRYPERIPDWLWKDQRRSAYYDEDYRKQLEYDIKVLGTLQQLDDSTAADKKTEEIARSIASKFQLKDLAADGLLITSGSNRIKFSVQIDPVFDDESRKTIIEATKLFASCALDDRVIESAFNSSTATPSPMPDQYTLQNGKPIADSFGNRVFTEAYMNFLKDRQRPVDAESFKLQLKSALSRSDGDPALLVILFCLSRIWKVAPFGLA